MRGIIVVRAFDGVDPELHRIAPICQLRVTRARQCKQDDYRRRPGDPFSVTPSRDNRTSSPNQRDEKTNMRQVCVAVSIRLAANLQQTDYRQQRNQEPKPAEIEIWKTFSVHKYRPRKHA